MEFPEGYESGTLNSPGIIGLGASVKWIKRIGIKEIHEHEMELLAQLYEDLSNMRNIEIYGPKDMNERSGIITINIEHMDCEEAAASLWKDFRIAVREDIIAPDLPIAP